MSVQKYVALLSFVLTWSGLYVPNARASDLTSLFFSMTTPDHVEFVDDGQEIHMSLDQRNASGFESYDAYLFGYFNMRMKLVPGDSAGTVTTYYFTSAGDHHDELDFEFLGNVSGQPLVLQTNVYSNGVGGREQRIYVWFDPTTDFHNYTLLWNRQLVVFYVDGVPIRVFPNIETTEGVPYLRSQPMKVYATIWDGDSWATEGGLVKIDWTHAPFTASYRDFIADACSETATASASDCAATKWWDQVAYQALDAMQLEKLKWVQNNLTVYDYCTDVKRYNVTPPECLYSIPISTAATAPSSISSSSPIVTNPSAPLPSVLSPDSALSPAGARSNSASHCQLGLISSSLFFTILSLIHVAFS